MSLIQSESTVLHERVTWEIVIPRKPMITEADNFPCYALVQSNIILYYTFYSMFAADIMILSKELCYYLNLLEVIEQMLWSTHSEIQIVVLQILVARILQNYAFLSNRMHLFNSSGNLDKFSMDRMSRNMIELAARFECPTDLRYFFMYYKETFRHRGSVC